MRGVDSDGKTTRSLAARSRLLARHCRRRNIEECRLAFGGDSLREKRFPGPRGPEPSLRVRAPRQSMHCLKVGSKNVSRIR